MDASDFYDTAVLALKAIENSAPMNEGESLDLRQEAVVALRDFIRAADEERAVNNSKAAYRCHVREGDA